MSETLSYGQAVAFSESYHDELNRLGLLLEVAEAIAVHRDLDELFHDLAERLPRIVPFDYINLIARSRARRHAPAPPGGAGTDHDQAGMELPIDESPGGLVWKTQQPLVVEDLRWRPVSPS